MSALRDTDAVRSVFVLGVAFGGVLFYSMAVDALAVWPAGVVIALWVLVHPIAGALVDAWDGRP